MKKNGFTLVEITVAATIGTLVLMITYVSFIAGEKIHQKSLLNAELSQNGRIALDRMTRDIRQTGEIVTTLSETEPDPPQDSIRFRDGHNNTIQYISYYLDGNELKRDNGHYYFTSDPSVWVYAAAEDNAGTPASYTIDATQTIAQYTSYLSFYGEKTVAVELKFYKNQKELEFKTKIFGRNL